jgi:integrase
MSRGVGGLLLSRHNVYYFRMLLPKRIMDLYPGIQKEIRWSLGTRSKSEAIRRARYTWAAINKELDMMLRKKENWTPPTEEENKQFVIDRLAACKAERDIQIMLADRIKRKAYEEAFRRMAPPELLAETYPQQGQIESNFTFHKQNQPKLSDVMKSFVEERLRTEAWRPKTKLENLAILNELQQIVGDIPMSQIRTEQLREYKQIQQKLPPNINKNNGYVGKNIFEIAALKGTKKRSLGTINKNIARVRAFFQWAMSNGYTDRNYAEGINIKVNDSMRKQRNPYVTAELQALLSGKEYMQPEWIELKEAHRFWIILLGMFTGARLEELCQLYSNDVFEQDGIAVISINDDASKKLKNQASRRIIPIHPKLLELGFLSYVKSIHSNGSVGLLFPELQKQRDGYSQRVSKWFARYKKQCGILDSTKVFHSFRHTVSNHLKQKGVSRELAAAILGHSEDSMTYGRYAKKYSPQVLLPVISQLDYGVDFQHLLQCDLNPYLSETNIRLSKSKD